MSRKRRGNGAGARTGRAWVAAFVTLAVACGARTGLLVDEPPDDVDAGHDARRDVLRDVPEDLPAIDVTAPPDVDLRDCPDAALTLIYVISERFELFSFDPATRAFRLIGKITCPGAGQNTPFSMAVDHTGIARIVFTDGSLYRVSTATAACTATPYVPSQQGFVRFGMGYSSDGPGLATETLFVANDDSVVPGKGLASIDDAFTLHPIGPMVPDIARAELTGTGAGDLFAFYEKANQDTFIGQLDKTTAHVIGESPLPGVRMGNGWAFAFWGGDFWVFTAPGGDTRITRFRPSDGSVTTVVDSLGTVIVGAGVSTCAPGK